MGTHLNSSFPFIIVNSGFAYLGVYIAKTFANLFKENFLVLLPKIKLDFERLSLLNLSRAARINAIKMNIFLVPFQCIPFHSNFSSALIFS